MANNNIGPKRLVVGAHYGVKDWLVQRVTAVLMVVYTAVLFFLVFTSSTPSYEGWAALFAQQWFKLFSAVTLLALAAVGALSGLTGGAGTVRPALRVLVWGAIAMAVTFGVGTLFGAVV